jgi:hypothetical protein
VTAPVAGAIMETSAPHVAATIDNPRLRHALQMAAKGLGVFPLRPGTKHPYKGEGIRAASTDPAAIRRWFGERPDMNYGCCTTDFVVLDVDCKGGAPGLQSLETLGAVPDTLQVATPSGGLHIYLGCYHTGQADIAAGINVRGHNGYVVGPGCRLEGLAEPYRVIHDAEIAPTPTHIAAKLRPVGHRLELATASEIELDTSEAVARAMAYLESKQGQLQGGRNNGAYALACALRGYGISEQMAVGLLNARWNARNSPPLSPHELAEVVRNAYAYAQNAAGILAPEAELEAIPDDKLPAETPAEGEAPAAEREWFRPFQVVRDAVTHPRRPWLVPNFLLRGHLTGLISPGGIGKSSLALGLALGCAAGDVSALGFEMARGLERCPVVLISTEDDDAEIWARMWGYCHRHGLPLEQLEGLVHVFDGGPDRPFKSVARDPKSGLLRRTKMLASLNDYVARVGARLVVFDPLVETHDANESDNAEVAVVMAAMRSCCRANDAAGLVVHHSRKLSSLDGPPSPDNSARGASALVNGFRLNFLLSRPTAALGLSEAEAAPLFRLDKGKGNYVPPGRDTRWYRTVGLQMPNGDPETGEPGTITHAVEMYDTEPAKARVRSGIMALVVDALEMAGGALTLTEAARALAADPVLGAGGERSCRDRLEQTFAGGLSADGYTVRLVVENPESARPRRVLRLAA